MTLQCSATELLIIQLYYADWIGHAWAESVLKGLSSWLLWWLDRDTFMRL